MLFAQQVREGPQVEILLYPLIALVVSAAIFALVFVVLLLRHLRFAREQLHDERLKMIEMGYPVEDSKSTKRQEKFMHNAFWISFWMVVAVPGSAFSAAVTASNQIEAGVGVLLAIWIGASAASVAAVVCAAVLMIHSRSQREEESESKLPKKPLKQFGG